MSRTHLAVILRSISPAKLNFSLKFPCYLTKIALSYAKMLMNTFIHSTNTIKNSRKEIIMKNSKGTPSKETGAKNNNSDNDVDYKNSIKTEDSRSKSTSNKAPSSGNIRGV